MIHSTALTPWAKTTGPAVVVTEEKRLETVRVVCCVGGLRFVLRLLENVGNAMTSVPRLEGWRDSRRQPDLSPPITMVL
jgi:hypothetical protein